MFARKVSPACSRLTTLTLLCCLFLAILLPQSVAVAQTSDTDTTPNPAYSLYAEHFKVPYEEAERRLLLQYEMTQLSAKIGGVESSYAGSWIEHEPTFGFVVAFTVPEGDALVAKYLGGIEWAELVRTVQARYTIPQLEEKLRLAVSALRGTDLEKDLIYGSGLNIKAGKVSLHTPDPTELSRRLANEPAFNQASLSLDDIEFVFQAHGMAPAEYKYPYVLGGSPLTSCTAGYVLRRNSDSRRFMATAGHCSDSNQGYKYGGSPTDDVFAGLVLFQVDPTSTPYARADFQVHNSWVRDISLTNLVRWGASNTSRVIFSTLKNDSFGGWACKYGKSTGYSCGIVSNLNYSPGAGWANTYREKGAI